MNKTCLKYISPKSILCLFFAGLFVLTLFAFPARVSADEAKQYVFTQVSGGEVLNSTEENKIVDLGGISSVFVYLSVMKLVEDGKIDLNESAKTYLGEDFFADAGFNYDFTTQHLLNHTAGFQNVLNGRTLLSGEEPGELRQILIATKPTQVYQPGDFVAYSEWGITLLAYLVECVSEESYVDYVHENILEPLGMDETSVAYDLSDSDYVLQNVDMSRVLYFNFYPCNSGKSTMGDLSKLLCDLTSGNSVILKEESIDRMFTPSLLYRDSSDGRIANGFCIYYEFANPVYGIRANSVNGNVEIYVSRDEMKGFACERDLYDTAGAVMPYSESLFGKREFTEEEFRKNIGDLGGVYQKTNTVQKGRGCVSSLFDCVSLKGTSDHVLALSGRKSVAYFTQVSQREFVTVNGEIGYFYSDSSNNRILQLPLFDMVSYPKALYYSRFALMIAYYFSIGYSVIALLAAIVTLFAHLIKKKPFEKNRFYKFHVIECVTMLAHGIIYHAMLITMLLGINDRISRMSGIMYYFGILITLVYLVFFFRTGIREDCDKKLKIMYYTTGFFGIMQILFTFMFTLTVAG